MNILNFSIVLGSRQIPLSRLNVYMFSSRECYGEINPLCTILGGVIAQDVLKAVSQKDQPHNNFFFFDGVLSCGSVEQIGHPVWVLTWKTISVTLTIINLIHQ